MCFFDFVHVFHHCFPEPPDLLIDSRLLANNLIGALQRLRDLCFDFVEIRLRLLVELREEGRKRDVGAVLADEALHLQSVPNLRLDRIERFCAYHASQLPMLILDVASELSSQSRHALFEHFLDFLHGGFFHLVRVLYHAFFEFLVVTEAPLVEQAETVRHLIADLVDALVSVLERVMRYHCQFVLVRVHQGCDL